MFRKGKFIETADHGCLGLGVKAGLSANRLKEIFWSDGMVEN